MDLSTAARKHEQSVSDDNLSIFEAQLNTDSIDSVDQFSQNNRSFKPKEDHIFVSNEKEEKGNMQDIVVELEPVSI